MSDQEIPEGEMHLDIVKASELRPEHEAHRGKPTEEGVPRYEVWYEDTNGEWALSSTTDDVDAAHEAVAVFPPQGIDAYIADRRRVCVIMHKYGRPNVPRRESDE